MRIQFCDLGRLHKKIKKQISQAIDKVIERGDFILGEEVRLFEEEFAAFCSAKFAVGLSSGTAALFLALKGLGIKQGDEVIVPAFTYIATALAVSYTGAKPVFSDIGEKTYNIDADKIKGAITKNTKAIIPVHLYGQPADMPRIVDIAKEYNLKVVEDAAQAHGASIKMPDGRSCLTGGIGDVGCFSFYPSKNLGALGDGGMVTTNDEAIYKKLLMLRDYGRTSKHEHAIIGFNSRLDTIQAAVLRLKLKRLKKWNSMRQEAALRYNQLLKDTEGVITPFVLPFTEHVYHIYAIRTKRRDRLADMLKEKQVSSIVHYPVPLHLQKAYASLGYKLGSFPVSERVASEIISLPMFPYLREAEIKFVAGIIKENLKG